MFRAKLLSLSSGQSYSDIEILELQDLENYGINRDIFGDDTLAFYANGNLIVGSAYNLRVIILDTKPEFAPGRSGADSIQVERIILDKDIVYDNCNVYTNTSQLVMPNIMPNFRKIVFTNTSGTIIALSRNVIGLMNKDNRAGGSDRVVPIRSYSARPKDPKVALKGNIKNPS